MPSARVLWAGACLLLACCGSDASLEAFGPEPRSPDDQPEGADDAPTETDVAPSEAPRVAPLGPPTLTAPPALPMTPPPPELIRPSTTPAPAPTRIVTQDIGHAVAADAQGNVWLAGNAQGMLAGARGEAKRGSFVAAYDAAGQKRWIRQYDEGFRLIRAMVVCADGDLVVAGDAGSGDAFVARLDGEGETRWARTFGTSGADYATALALAADGSIYVTSNEQHAPFESSALAGLSRYTAEGELLFHETWGGSPGAETQDVAVRDGTVYVAGRTNARFDPAFWSSGGGRWIGAAALRRFDADGQLRWERSFGERDAKADGLVIDAAGGAIVSGFDALPNGANDDAFDTFLARYDADGTRSWRRQLGTGIPDTEQSVALLADGDLLVVGNAGGDFDGDTATSNGAFVMRSDAEGKPRWIHQGIGDVATALAVDGLGRAFATGWLFNRQTPAGPLALEVDVFLARFESDGRGSRVDLLGSR